MYGHDRNVFNAMIERMYELRLTFSIIVSNNKRGF